MTHFIDTRPRAPNAVFEMIEVLPAEVVRVKNVETRRSFLVPGQEFRRHYERIKW